MSDPVAEFEGVIMGWRDGMRFQAWLEEHIETLVDGDLNIR